MCIGMREEYTRTRMWQRETINGTLSDEMFE